MAWPLGAVAWPGTDGQITAKAQRIKLQQWHGKALPKAQNLGWIFLKYPRPKGAGILTGTYTNTRMPSNRTFQSRYWQFRVFGRFKATRLRSVARYGDRPRSNIFRGLAVGIVLMAAPLTTEVQAFPVGCRDMTAGTTPTACVAGTDRFQFNADSRSLVCNLESHIGVWPSVNFGSEIPPLAQRTVSNVREFFYHDLSCPDLNRVADQCLRGGVQEHSGYGSLVPGHPSQEPPGISGANRLDSRTSASDARTTVIQFTPVVEKWFSVCRVGSDKHSLYSHIDSDNTALGPRLWNLNLAGEDQIPLLAHTFEPGILPSSIGHGARVGNGKDLSPKCNSFIGAVEIPLPDNRHHGASELGQAPFLVSLGRLVGSTHSLAQRTSQLRRKAHLAEVGVVGFCESVRVQFLSFEGNFRKPVRGLQPNDEESVSFCAAGNFEFDYADCFHYIEYYYQEKTMSMRDCKAELRKNLWGSAFWTPSFFAASCGGAPIETLKLYVQSQQTKAALKGEVSTQ